MRRRSLTAASRSRVPDPQQYDHRRIAFGRIDRLGRLDQHPDAAGGQRLSGADECPGARRALSFARLSAQRDRIDDRRDALHRARDRSRTRSFGRTRTFRTPAIRKPGSSAASTASIPRRSRFNRCRATQARSDSSPSRPCRASPGFPQNSRKTALMAALPDARQAFAARVLSLGFAAAAAAALSGCGVDYASSAPAFPGDFQERHPIVVASAPTSLDIFAVGGALDARSIANIRAFAERYRHYGSGDIAILAPAGTTANSRAVHEVRVALAGAGANGRVLFGTYASPDKDAAAPIRLSFIGVKATVPTAVRPVARGSRFGIIGRRVEERAILELRLRHPVDDCRPGRRPARFRPTAGARAIRRRHAHPSHRGRPQRPGSGHAVERHCADPDRRRSLAAGDSDR